MIIKYLCLILVAGWSVVRAFSQSDTLPEKILDPAEIRASANRAVQGPEDTRGAAIMVARKAEIINVRVLQADLSANLSRQLFSRTPGVQHWENDGSGIQTGIAVRGLSPNRSWEFNVRQNGTDISPDVFGYPEAYYTPPAEAIDRIEMVRGASALQWGPQFGGLLNYIIRKGATDKKIEVESRQTLGAFGLFNTFSAAGGTIGKVNYYTWFHYRRADGWRDNSAYHIRTGYAALDYHLSARTTIGMCITLSGYTSQQPGGLTDAQFTDDARMSVRSRNWFSAPWNLINLSLDHVWSETSQLQVRVFGGVSERNSVGFLSAPTTPDAVLPGAEAFANRQVDRDHYKSLGTEVRWLKHYRLAGAAVVSASGIRAYGCETLRNQQGTGTDASGFDLAVNGAYARALQFGTYNFALFNEQCLKPNDRLAYTFGMRLENITSTIDGRIAPNNGVLTRQAQRRQLLLFSAGMSYKPGAGGLELYANISEAFRPVTYAEITPSATTDVVDPALRDASGYTAESGIRGWIGRRLYTDGTVFLLDYRNRTGVLVQNGVNFRTNVGDSRSAGVEWYSEYNLGKWENENQLRRLQLFASLSWMNATYTSWDNPAAPLTGNRVENAPWYNHRVGLVASVNRLSLNAQVGFTGMAFSDAGNTLEPTANGQAGPIPAYHVADLSLLWKLSERCSLQSGINNLTDHRYFTRRAGGYPGPGLLPGMGRSWFFTAAFKL